MGIIIVKDAFNEGYETDIPWNESQSKALEHTILDYSFYNQKIAQVCPKTGSIINVFKNIKCAEHYQETVLNSPSKQLKLAIISNWKCAGFNWHALEEDSLHEITIEFPELKNPMYRQGYYTIDKNNKIRSYDTLTELERGLGISARHRIQTKKYLLPINGYICIKKTDYEPDYDYVKAFKDVKLVEIFDTHEKKYYRFNGIVTASKHIGCSYGIVRYRFNGKTKKNILINDRYKVTRGYVYDNN